MKSCNTCHGIFPASTEYFHRWKTSKDGLSFRCKRCQRVANKKSYYANHEERKEKGRTDYYRVKETDYDRLRETNREASKRYHQKGSESVRRARRDAARRAYKRYVLKFRLKTLNRRSGAVVEVADIEALHQSQRGKCYWCNKDVGMDFHIDHYIPVARGGAHHISNLVLACEICNKRKSDRMPEVFRQILANEQTTVVEHESESSDHLVQQESHVHDVPHQLFSQ